MNPNSLTNLNLGNLAFQAIPLAVSLEVVMSPLLSENCLNKKLIVISQ